MNVIIINLDVKKQLASKNRIILSLHTLHITRNVFYSAHYVNKSKQKGSANGRF